MSKLIKKYLSPWSPIFWELTSSPEEIKLRLTNTEKSSSDSKISQTNKSDMEIRKEITDYTKKKKEYEKLKANNAEAAVANALAMGANFKIRSNATDAEKAAMFDYTWNQGIKPFEYASVAASPIGTLTGMSGAVIGNKVGPKVNEKLGKPISDEQAAIAGSLVGSLLPGSSKPIRWATTRGDEAIYGLIDPKYRKMFFSNDTYLPIVLNLIDEHNNVLIPQMKKIKLLFPNDTPIDDPRIITDGLNDPNFPFVDNATIRMMKPIEYIRKHCDLSAGSTNGNNIDINTLFYFGKQLPELKQIIGHEINHWIGKKGLGSHDSPLSTNKRVGKYFRVNPFNPYKDNIELLLNYKGRYIGTTLIPKVKAFLSTPANKNPIKAARNLKPVDLIDSSPSVAWRRCPEEVRAEMGGWKSLYDEVGTLFKDMDVESKLIYINNTSKRFRISKENAELLLEGLSAAGYFKFGGKI